MECPSCDGEGYIEDYEDYCCGQYLPDGECCASIYGDAYIQRVFVDINCPDCNGKGWIPIDG